jgi:NB-ARC domain/TIR domain/CobQ/CobB/MinD/ParA nucleotide binding domain
VIFTFYSYKGGVGRSMAVANVAQWMRLQGLRVLIVDWDLEAPGIEEFFLADGAELESARSQPGLIDLLQAYKRTYPSIKRQLHAPLTDAGGKADPQATAPLEAPPPLSREELVRRLGQLLPPAADATQPLRDNRSGDEGPGTLRLLTAGWRAGERFQAYAAAVQSFDWTGFYADFDGEIYFDWLRQSLQIDTDVVLIDSRTGVTEMGGVCTRHLADAVVCLCAPNRQNLRGLVEMIHSFQRSTLTELRGSALDVVVVPTRVENSEVSLLNQFASEFQGALDRFTPERFKQAKRSFWDLRIPYVPRYAYAERLTVGVDDTAGDLERAYQMLTAHLLLLTPPFDARLGPTLAADLMAIAPSEAPSRRTRVLVSFAEQDGAAAAQIVQRALQTPNGEFESLDAWRHWVGGHGWAAQIDEAFAAADVVIPIVTPAALVSASCRHEWREARRRGIPLVPVMAMDPNVATLSSVPRWLRSAPWIGAEQVGQRLAGALRQRTRPAMVPDMTPPLPSLYVDRPRLLIEVVLALIDADADAAARRGPRLALVGLGGGGKTTLAIAACRDARVVDCYDDGILWLSFGKDLDLVHALTQLYAALTGERPAFLSIEDATTSLRQRLRDRRLLLVLDDLWDRAQLRPFLQLEPAGLIVTTRNRSVLEADFQTITVGELSRDEAARLLAMALPSPPSDRTALDALAESLGNLPLMLAMVAGLLKERVARGDTPDRAVNYVRAALMRRGVTAFDRGDAGVGEPSLSGTLESTLALLSADERWRCEALAAFPESAAIALAAAQAIWSLEPFEAEELALRLDSRSLIVFDLATQTIRMHRVVRSFLRQSLRNLETLEAQAQRLLAELGKADSR